MTICSFRCSGLLPFRPNSLCPASLVSQQCLCQQPCSQVSLRGRAFAGLASSAYVLPAMARRVAVSICAPASKPHGVRRAAFSPEKSACGLPVSVFLAIFAAQTASGRRKRKARSGRRQAWRAAPERQPRSKTKKKFGLKVLVLKNRTTAKMFKARERATIKFTSLGAWTARVYLCLRFYLAVDLV